MRTLGLFVAAVLIAGGFWWSPWTKRPAVSDEFRPPIPREASVAKFKKLKGAAVFPGPASDNDQIWATDPEYQYKGLTVVEKGEAIAGPMFSLKGGRGELVFGMNQGKPITGRTVGELHVENGQLIFKGGWESAFTERIPWFLSWTT